MTARRRATPLETVSLVVPEEAVEAYEAALLSACATVGLFLEDEEARSWRLEGVKEVGAGEETLLVALALAAAASGVSAPLLRDATEAEGWLARNQSEFPEQFVGERFAVRGTHLDGTPRRRRMTLVLDAGLAFGSGEHGSTRGCLLALERQAWRRPRRILDLGTGSGVLAMAAARLLGRRVLAVDHDPWSVLVARRNAAANGLRNRIAVRLGQGWSAPSIRGSRGGFDLVFANILARPLCLMAPRLAFNLAPGGVAILAGLLGWQARGVIAAHQRAGLRLISRIDEGDWATLVFRAGV